MKRLVLLILTGTLALGLCGCGSFVALDEQTNTQLVNPIKNVSQKEQVDQTGIALNAPEGATDVAYTIIETDGTEKIAQLTFFLDGKEVCLRAQATMEFEPGDISGLYYEWEEPVAATVDYCEAMIYLHEDVGYIAWLDFAPGVQYNLSMTSGADAQILEEMANAVFAPLQGDN